MAGRDKALGEIVLYAAVQLEEAQCIGYSSAPFANALGNGLLG